MMGLGRYFYALRASLLHHEENVQIIKIFVSKKLRLAISTPGGYSKWCRLFMSTGDDLLLKRLGAADAWDLGCFALIDEV